MWGALIATLAAAAAAAPPQQFGVFLAPTHSSIEQTAAWQMAALLANATGTVVPVTPQPSGRGLTLCVGYSAATSASCGLRGAELHGLGNESFVVSSNSSGGVKPGFVAISGGNGSQRGTLYATNHYMRHLGFRFFAPNATSVPSPAVIARAAAAPVGITFVPTMELRTLESYETNGNQVGTGQSERIDSGNLEWMARSGENGCYGQVGGCMVYATPPGSCHTSYSILGGVTGSMKPPPALFQKHRSWFWPRDNGETYGQLCWTNRSLVAFVIAQAEMFLREQPDANIISVSQNDVSDFRSDLPGRYICCYIYLPLHASNPSPISDLALKLPQNGRYCNTSDEWDVIIQEGSPMGPLLRAVNQVADALAAEFPHVLVDTLAYQYSRPATKLTKPRKNVVIRLANIECNFAQPLTHPSNEPFQKDMVDWAAISNRTYIWNCEWFFSTLSRVLIGHDAALHCCKC